MATYRSPSGLNCRGQHRSYRKRAGQSFHFEALESRRMLAATGGIIDGTVFRDNDLNGVLTDGEQIAAATVELYLDSDENGELDVNLDEMVGTTMSADDGGYRFFELPEGTYFAVQPAQTIDGRDLEMLVSAPIVITLPTGVTVDFYESDSGPVQANTDVPIMEEVFNESIPQEILGGQRDLRAELTAGGGFVDVWVENGDGDPIPDFPPSIAFQSFDAAGTGSVIWDGVDSVADGLQPSGLGEFDLSEVQGISGRGVGLCIGAVSFDAEVELLLRIYSGPDNISVATIEVPGDPDLFQDFYIPFDGMSLSGLGFTSIGADGGADFASIGAVELVIDAPSFDTFGVVGGISVVGAIPQTSDFVNAGIVSVDLEKFVNGNDADDPTDTDVPQINVNTTPEVTFSYEVTNTGTMPLPVVVLEDDQLGTISEDAITDRSLNDDSLLDPGEVWTYEVDDTAATGLQTNIAAVTVENAIQISAMDTDAANYVGFQPSIDIEVFTNGEQADLPTDPDVPQILVGETLNWTYVVTNSGTGSLADITVTDSVLGRIGDIIDQGDGDEVLSEGESWTFLAQGTAESGPYENVGTASATAADGSMVSDQDLSHYVGITLELAIAVEVLINGASTTAPGPIIDAGCVVLAEYLVTTVENAQLEIALDNVIVVDDNGTPSNTADDITATFISGDTDGDGLLDPTETWRFESEFVAVLGEQTRTATVAATQSMTTIDVSSTGQAFISGIDPLIVIDTSDDGPGSLRYAIETANMRMGPQTITFAIPDTDPNFVDSNGDSNADIFRIQPLSPLPNLEDTSGGTTIDGSSQRVFGGDTNTGGPEVILDGSITGGTGLNLVSSQNVVRELGIQQFTDQGILIGATAMTADGNRVSGSQIRDNGAAGILIGFGATNSFIGTDDEFNQGNEITGNGGAGIAVDGDATLGHSIRTNSISDNAGLGIDLGAMGITPNDDGDTDVGPNGLTNRPTILAVSLASGVLVGELSAAPSRNYAIDFYAVASADPSGSGEGDRFLSSINVTTNEAGFIEFSSSGLGFESGDSGVSATATVLDGPAAGSTSEFSVVVGESAPAIDIEKSTNGNDADEAPGPTLEVGSTARFDYAVSNTGNTQLRITSILDDNGTPNLSDDDFMPMASTDASGFNVGDTNQNDLLDTNEVWQYTASRTVTVGPYANQVTVVAEGLLATAVSDSDVSNHLGAEVETGASITGISFDDQNGNAVQDTGEAGVAGVVVYIDANGNEQLDSGEQTAVTSASGVFTFENVADGNYSIRQVLEAGSAQTMPVGDFRASEFIGTPVIRSVAPGDFDEDGYQDIALVGEIAGAVVVLINDGTGSFSNSIEIEVGERPHVAIAEDFNGDSHMDLAVTIVGTLDTPNSSELVLLAGDGNGNFSEISRINVGNGPVDAVPLDFDLDGNVDLALASFAAGDAAGAGTAIADGRLIIMQNNGSGTFSEAQRIDTGDQPISVAAADIDGDDDPDLAVANYLGDNVVIVTNNGGSFSTQSVVTSGMGPGAVAFGEINGDDNIDLVVSFYGRTGVDFEFEANDTLQLLTGNDNGGFELTAEIALPDSARAEYIGMFDYDLDQDDDILIVESERDLVTWYRNDGGTLVSAMEFAAPAGPEWITIGHFNDDGNPDMVAGSIRGEVTVVLNAPAALSANVADGQDVTGLAFGFVPGPGFIPATPPNAASSSGVEETNSRSFDVNQDGLVNSADVLSVVNALIRRGNYDAQADVNQDGVVSPLDALLVIGQLETRMPRAAASHGVSTEVFEGWEALKPNEARFRWTNKSLETVTDFVFSDF